MCAERDNLIYIHDKLIFITLLGVQNLADILNSEFSGY